MAAGRESAEGFFTAGNRTEFTSGDGVEKIPPTLPVLKLTFESCEILWLHSSE